MAMMKHLPCIHLINSPEYTQRQKLLFICHTAEAIRSHGKVTARLSPCEAHRGLRSVGESLEIKQKHFHRLRVCNFSFNEKCFRGSRGCSCCGLQ